MTANRTHRARLGLQALEARDVPAGLLDLSFVGAEASAAGALLRQAAPVSQQGDQFQTFLKLRHGGAEAGFNTDARPFRMDQRGGLATTHALKLSDVPTVVVNGVTYREFLLDVNQRLNHPFVSLDELRLFTGNDPNLRGYNGAAHTLGGRSAVFDLDGDGNVWVKLNANLTAGTGRGDAVVLVPDSVFGTDQYVFLYSKFGAHFGANGGSEGWGVRLPGQVTATGTLSGTVFADMNGNGTREPDGTTADPVPEYGLAGVTVQLQYTDAQGQTVTRTTTTDAQGNYQFTGLAAGTYTIGVLDPAAGFMTGITTQYTSTLGSGQSLGGFDFDEPPLPQIG